MIALPQTIQPILSQSCPSVEGFHGVDIECPAWRDSGLNGSVSAMIRPDQCIGGIVAPLCQGSAASLLAMQNNGTSLYDGPLDDGVS